VRAWSDEMSDRDQHFQSCMFRSSKFIDLTLDAADQQSAPAQKSTMMATVEEYSKSENIGNGPEGRKADVTYVRTQEPPKVSYADIVKRDRSSLSLLKVRGEQPMLLSLSRNNPIIRNSCIDSF
jgi:hypothetical protein